MLTNCAVQTVLFFPLSVSSTHFSALSLLSSWTWKQPRGRFGGAQPGLDVLVLPSLAESHNAVSSSVVGECETVAEIKMHLLS